MNKKIKYTLFLLLLITLPAAYNLIVPGSYEPQDLHHLADIYEMSRAISSGQVPPRLGPDFTFGYSYPLFNFYYLLPFYIGAFFYFLFGSLTAGFESVLVLCIIFSVFGMYLFLREFFNKFSSFVGSVVFLYTPYRAVQIYVRGAIGEALALSLFPFVLWGLIRLIKAPKSNKPITLLTIITTLFIISHNYLWVLSLPFIFLLIIFLKKTQKEYPVKQIILVAFLSLGLSAYWLLPALLENKLVSSITPFPLIDHFPFLKQLIIPSWGYGASVWGPGDGMSFQIGLVNITIVILALLYSLYLLFLKLKNKQNIRKVINPVLKEKTNMLAIWAMCSFFICIFFMNIRSYPLWRLVPFHDFIQFPWRLLIFTTFFSSVIAAFVIKSLPDIYSKFAGFLFIVSSIVLTYSYFSPSQIVHKKDEIYLTRFFETITYSEDYLLLPSWVGERPEHAPLTKISVKNGYVNDILETSPISWSAEVVTPIPTTVIFQTYYFPGWVATIDGKKANITPGKPYGQIEINVSSGKHTVAYYWRETKLRKIADYISVGSLMILVIMFTRKRIYRHA